MYLHIYMVYTYYFMLAASVSGQYGDPDLEGFRFFLDKMGSTAESQAYLLCYE